MSAKRVIGVMVEPPLSVANSLLEATRRYFGSGGASGGDVRFVPPSHYAVPLIVCPADADRSPDAVAIALRQASVIVQEFAVQLAPLARVQGGDGVVASELRVQEGELERVVSALEAAFQAVGLDDFETPQPWLSVAVVAGGQPADAGEVPAPEVRDVPLAGWLVAGLCVAEGEAGSVPGTWLLKRLRTQPLKRLGAR